MAKPKTVGAPYPRWVYYPYRDRPPVWVDSFVAAVRSAGDEIRSADVEGLTSNKVLKALRPGLERIGYRVESGNRKEQRIVLPVLFGDEGRPRVEYAVDAVHDDEGVLVEVEAGRGARGNAVFRDLVRSSLIVGARFLVLGVMDEYRHRSSGKEITVRSYEEARRTLDAIYASQRLQLPFEGVLLLGY